MVDGEDLRAFQEERPPLGEARLDGGEVHFCGIGLDLPEVGIDRGFEGHVGPEAHLDVASHALGQIPAVVERISRVRGRRASWPPRHVGQKLDPPRRPDARDAAQSPKRDTHTRSVRGTSTQ